ncbi:FKBP-type peptidyl-prolyl cis-trans isomerase [Raoultibacter phocaeensis]|uniref:FKBP-type peptidyl-prolyl cis-trans isomerase n=1 Tax=Raoultibacter phocaeensis TaxID=2479841 RepID=UPI0011180F27|nr:FKBP-type peptidyl-prolyl cis-trans isomerase [Raoultibacter phocaeensis]
MGDTNRIGRVASIRYRGGVKGEEPADDHSTGAPLEIVLGDMRVPRGIEEAVSDMQVGEQREVEIPCELGYGRYQEKLASWRPKSMVDDGYRLKVGDVIFWTNPDDGRKMPVWVVDETEDNIRLDFNHPFAGKTLVYWIELVDLK